MKVNISIRSDDVGIDLDLPEIELPQKCVSVLREGTKIASVIAEAIRNIQSDTEEK